MSFSLSMLPLPPFTLMLLSCLLLIGILQEEELDGCYVLKTDVPKENLTAQTAHDRYKDLSKIESAFGTMKTALEKIRPIFVRKEGHTRRHVFVAMLAYMNVKHITDKFGDTGYTCRFVIESLDKVQYPEYQCEGKN